VRKVAGLVSFVLALLSLPVSVVSGGGVFIAIVSIIFSSASLALGGIRYALATFFLATLSIFALSPWVLYSNTPHSLILMGTSINPLFGVG